MNRSLGNILRSIVYENLKQWDLTLAQVEFSYNDSPNKSKGMSPFQIVYGIHLRGVYEIRNLEGQERRSVDGEDFASSMLELQENVKKKLQESVGKYKQRAYMKRKEVNFQVGYLIMAYLRKESFLKGTY